jgi:hypothetical protein
MDQLRTGLQMIARYAVDLLASVARASGARAATPLVSTVADGATVVRSTSSGAGPVQTAISNVILAAKAIGQFARRHPKFRTAAVLVVVANEIRGLVTVVVYLKTFGLALPA